MTIIGDRAIVKGRRGDYEYPVKTLASRVSLEPCFRIEECSGGFPLRCLWGAKVDEGCTDVIYSRGFIHTVALWRTEKPVFWNSDMRLRVPVGLIWTGLALDCVLYSALWCGLFLAPGTFRRRTRRRRNHCINCSYDRAGLDAASVCPECGASNQGRP
jgi:hypothetical protein